MVVFLYRCEFKNKEDSKSYRSFGSSNGSNIARRIPEMCAQKQTAEKKRYAL